MGSNRNRSYGCNNDNGDNKMSKIKDYIRNLITPTTKSSRELLSDAYMTFLGIVISIIAIKSGGEPPWLRICGFVIIGMLVLLFFMPEN